MSDLNFKRGKHLTLDDREEIMECLNKGISFKTIAKKVGKSPTTISREVKKHFEVKPLDKRSNNHKPCPSLLRAPFVCNSCEKRRTFCSFQKQLYIAKSAQLQYETLLREAREGIPLSKKDFWDANNIITQGIKKGQRLYHIMQTNEVGFSKSSAYRHLHRGYLSVDKLDFPRVVKFKTRKQSRPDSVPKALRTGRTFNDFRSYIEEQDITSWVEMDTVIGRVGGKVIMTFHFTSCNFMFALLLDNKTAEQASAKIRKLKERLYKNEFLFGEIFPLLLTDNGGEFSDIFSFINDLDGVPETQLFFCDPYQSSQKPNIEKNHTLFRDIVPKGNSFDDFTQDTVNLIFSHINGVKRKCLNGKSPYQMFSFLYDKSITSLLGISEIPAEDVIQSPKLLTGK